VKDDAGNLSKDGGVGLVGLSFSDANFKAEDIKLDASYNFSNGRGASIPEKQDYQASDLFGASGSRKFLMPYKKCVALILRTLKNQCYRSSQFFPGPRIRI